MFNATTLCNIQSSISMSGYAIFACCDDGCFSLLLLVVRPASEIHCIFTANITCLFVDKLFSMRITWFSFPQYLFAFNRETLYPVCRIPKTWNSQKVENAKHKQKLETAKHGASHQKQWKIAKQGNLFLANKILFIENPFANICFLLSFRVIAASLLFPFSPVSQLICANTQSRNLVPIPPPSSSALSNPRWYLLSRETSLPLCYASGVCTLQRPSLRPSPTRLNRGASDWISRTECENSLSIVRKVLARAAIHFVWMNYITMCLMWKIWSLNGGFPTLVGPTTHREMLLCSNGHVKHVISSTRRKYVSSSQFAWTKRMRWK